jgi:hypothetical protein
VEGGDNPTRGSGAFNAVTPRTTVTAVMTSRAPVVTAETTTVGASEAMRMKFANEFVECNSSRIVIIVINFISGQMMILFSEKKFCTCAFL